MSRPSVDGKPIDTPSASDYIQQVNTFIHDLPFAPVRQALELIQGLAMTTSPAYADIKRDVEEISRTLKRKPKLVRDLNSVLPQGFVVHCPLIQHLKDIDVLEYLVLDTSDGGEILSTSVDDVPYPSSTWELRMILPLEDKWKSIRAMCLDNGQWGSCLSQLLQREFEDPQIDVIYKRFVSRRQIHLAKLTGTLPPSLFLHNLVRSEATYRVESGGFADIAKATVKGTPICLKILRIYSNQEGDGVKQSKAFVRELLLWSRLSHPNILPFLGAHVNEGLRFVLISPWMKNGNLRTFLKANPDHDRLKACFQISCGLRYLHGLSPPIYHRDVKAVNVLVKDDLQCCLGDFGLSSIAGSQRLESKSFAGEGTLHWQAPEVILADSTESFEKMLDSAAADVYAYGCTVHEIYTGNHPFHNMNLAALIRVHMEKKKPELPDSSNLEMSEKLRDLFCSCWNSASGRPTMLNINSNLEAELASREASRPQSSNGHSLANNVDRVEVISLTPTEYTLRELESINVNPLIQLEKAPLFEDSVKHYPLPMEGFYDQQRGMFTPDQTVARSPKLVTPPVVNAVSSSAVKWTEIEVTKLVEDLALRQRDNISALPETPTVSPGRLPITPSPTSLSPDSPVFVPRTSIKAQAQMQKLSIKAAEFVPTKPLRSSPIQNSATVISPAVAATVATPATPNSLLARQSFLPQSLLNANAIEFTPTKRNRSPTGDELPPVFEFTQGTETENSSASTRVSDFPSKLWFDSSAET